MLARLQGATVTDRGDHLVIRTPGNPAFHWGNYVLAGQSWLDRPLADLVTIFHAEHPRAGHLAIGVDGVDGRVWGDHELAACGLEADRSVVMTAQQVLKPQHPTSEADFRMLGAGSGRDTDWAAAVDLYAFGHGDADPAESREFVRRRMAARRKQQEAGLGGWFGAFVDGAMVSGLGLFTDGSGLGRFQDVETRVASRRNGLAATLVHHSSVVALRDFGIRDLVMVADPDYSAIRIYRSLGFTEVETQVGLARPVHGP
jgi:ribosomal protein S18 acetylase RimI-like enzyme